MASTNRYLPFFFLALVAAVSITLKLHVYAVGAPYVTIDDNTLYNAGFLVWFGEAPPQRMYLESWVAGAISIATYIIKLIVAGNIDQLGLNIIADAYRDFTNAPEQYVLNYRAAMLTVDIATAWLVFIFAKHLFAQQQQQYWLAAFASALFLLSYNTLWCYLVARPDTLTSFFAMLGILFYYKSVFGERSNYLIMSAISLGCATGLKLHAALFVVFFALDMLRELCWAQAFKRIFYFGIIAVFIFLVTAGSALFDPLLYIKLRALNIKDDESPWIQWGEQVTTQLQGTGWLLSPLALGGAIYLFIQKKLAIPTQFKSLLFVSGLFILFFLSIRQLRAYWMLPALPLIYVSSIYVLTRLPSRPIQFIAVALISSIFILQINQQSREFDKAQYHELQQWVTGNASPDDVIYIVGFDTLFLPCNTQCLQNRKLSLERNIQSALIKQENFTARHVRLWEERASLLQIDMLENQSATGFNYYSINGMPLPTLAPEIGYEDIGIVLYMQGYQSPEADELMQKVTRDFTKVAVVNAPGGKAGTGGLPYDVYMRQKP
jgi:hypothetical protein